MRSLQLPWDGEVWSNYQTWYIPVKDILTFLSSGTLKDVPFSPSIAALLACLRICLRAAFDHVAVPAQLLVQGYAHLTMPLFRALGDEVCRDWRHLFAVLPHAVVRPATAEEVLAALEAVPASLRPLRPGRAVHTDGATVVIDAVMVTQRLFIELEMPGLQGEVANYRSEYFELAVQAAIDRSPRAPTNDHRALRGKTLRLAGRALTDVDALAETDDYVLIVSCKSVPYTAAYEAGEYRVIRNARTMIEKAVGDLARVVEVINQRLTGDNYAFSKPVQGVVCTPHVLVVPIGGTTKEVVSGLRAASSISEVARWWFGHGA